MSQEIAILKLVNNAKETLESLRRIEEHLISEDELNQLGHRIIYDPKTGWSKNLGGVHIDVSKIDPATGYQIKL